MRTIADWLFAAVLAAAEKNALISISCVFGGFNARVFVTAIAE